MQQRFLPARFVIASIVIGVAVIPAGCNQTPSPLAPSTSASIEPGTASTGAGAPASSSVNAAIFSVGAELAAVRRATARFHDIGEALAAGYTTANEPCVAIPGGPGMGIHARHDSLMGDQTLDPLRPELLLYQPNANGKLQLVGVEYFQVVLVRDGDPTTSDPPRPWIDHEPWPPDWEIVTPTPQLFGQTFDGPMPGHTPEMGWHWDLHAWIWAHNPDGLFAAFNPAIQCP